MFTGLGIFAIWAVSVIVLIAISLRVQKARNAQKAQKAQVPPWGQHFWFHCGGPRDWCRRCGTMRLWWKGQYTWVTPVIHGNGTGNKEVLYVEPECYRG